MFNESDSQIEQTPPANGGRSDVEEKLNVITHGIGFALSLVGAIALNATVWRHGDAWRIVGCTIYVASLIGVYAASTLSHWFQTPHLRTFFRALDQGFIYLLIVATYTPFSLAYLRTPLWWTLLAAMWAVALFGCFAKIFYFHRVHAVTIWGYVALGWLPIVSATALTGLAPAAALWLMLLGGVCYTVGTLFLIYDRRAHYFHALWHLLVIAGSSFHFLAIWLFVARVG